MSPTQERRFRYLWSPRLDEIGYPSSSPFDTRRAGKTRRILDQMGLLFDPGCEEIAPRALSREELERFHDPRYLDVLLRASSGAFDPEWLKMGLGSDECPVFPELWDYSTLAVGASVQGAELLLEDRADVVFNPSGGFHHAGPDYAAGFCYLNDVALATLRLADSGKRVLFLDVDVHHGDGVQNLFYDRRDVMTISMHESGKTLFPGTGFEDEIGEGEGRGYCVNVPLPEGTDDEAFGRAFERVVVPLIGAFAPRFIVLEVGMDALAGDPLAHLALTNNALADVTARVAGLRRPLLVTGGGGYNAEATARGWALIWTVLTGAAAFEDMALGLGGVMLGSTDWAGGLRDRVTWTDPRTRRRVDEAVDRTIDKLRNTLFPIHGIPF